MYGERLAAKIEAECKYTGTSRNEGYAYYRGVGDAINIVKRELPTEPLPATEEDDQ